MADTGKLIFGGIIVGILALVIGSILAITYAQLWLVNYLFDVTIALTLVNLLKFLLIGVIITVVLGAIQLIGGFIVSFVLDLF